MNILQIITNPKVFNYLIAFLYALSAIRFAFELRWLEVFYFLLVMALTLTINAMIRT